MHGLKVLMAKQYIDNLGEEASRGLREKAEQGHWPSVAPLGYVNDRHTRRIEVDPVRARLITQVFEWYASGEMSLRAVTAKARGLPDWTIPRSGRPLTTSEIHRLLRNPVYVGEFLWKGKRYRGAHEPVVSRALWGRTTAVFEAANPARYGKRRVWYTGLLSCGSCGCAITAERKKNTYTYYRCTPSIAPRCGSGYLREERLTELLSEVVGRVRIHRSKPTTSPDPSGQSGAKGTGSSSGNARPSGELPAHPADTRSRTTTGLAGWITGSVGAPFQSSGSSNSLQLGKKLHSSDA